MIPSRLTSAPMAKASVPAPLVPDGVPLGVSLGGEINHAEFLGLPFTLLTQAEVVDAITANCNAPYRYVVTPNAYHVVAAHDEPARMLPIYRSAWLSVCDSRIVRMLAWLDRRAIPLVTGSDLVAALLSRVNSRDRPDPPRRILIVGPSRDAEARLRDAYPNVTFEVMPAP